MLNIHARAWVSNTINPFGAWLARHGVTPDAITITGTVGATASALIFFTQGWWFSGTLLIWGFVMLDVLDGAVARASGKTTKFGAVLDSTGDRLADAAIFGSIAWYFARHDQPWMLAAAMLCLVLGGLTSYIRARAEGLGLNATVGIAERAERLIIVLVGTGLTGDHLRVPYVQAAALVDSRSGIQYHDRAADGSRVAAVTGHDGGMNAHGARDRALDLAFAAGWKATNRLPERVAAAGFRAAADVAVRRQSKGVQRLRANLRRVVGPQCPEPELDALVKSAMRSYGRYWLETFRLPTMNLDEVVARVEAGTEGAEHIDRAMAAGRGLILALPHMGNWDIAAVWLIRHGVPFTTVAERLRPESLYDRFVAYREGIGMRVLALTGGPRPAAEILAARLRSGECVCLVADRDLSRSGVNVEFFGATARMPAGPALLAATTGATLLPVGLWFTGDGGWGQHIGPPVDLLEQHRMRERVATGTQTLANAFAAHIAAHPSDWHMLQRLWLADLDASGLRGDAPEAALVPGADSTHATGG